VEVVIPVSAFLCLFEIANGKNDIQEIFAKLLKLIKEWSLDLINYVGFDFDVASTMVGNRIE
jgi:hypothetical protein